MPWGSHLSVGAMALQGTFHRDGVRPSAIPSNRGYGTVFPAGSAGGFRPAPGPAPVPSPAGPGSGSGSGAATGSLSIPAGLCYADGTCNLPTNLPGGCPVVDLQRPGPTDPASRIQIGDVQRWASWGYLSDKKYINAVKMQGAMEMLSALGAAVPSATAALTKNVGGAQAVVSREDAAGAQGFQNYGVYPYDKGVPATGAVSVVPQYHQGAAYF